MLANRWVVLVAAMLVWAIYFHTMDWFIMEAQGLPVDMTMMPR